MNLQVLLEFRQLLRIGRPNYRRCRYTQKPRHLRTRVSHLPHRQLTKQTPPPRYLPLPPPRSQFQLPKPLSFPRWPAGKIGTKMLLLYLVHSLISFACDGAILVPLSCDGFSVPLEYSDQISITCIFGCLQPSRSSNLAVPPAHPKFCTDFLDLFLNPIAVRANLAQKQNCQTDCGFRFFNADVCNPDFL